MRAIRGSVLAMGLSLLAAAAAAQTDPRADETFRPEGMSEPSRAAEHRDQRVGEPLRHELDALRSDIEYERTRLSSREHGRLDELRRRVDASESRMKPDMSVDEQRAMRREISDIRAELVKLQPATGREHPDGIRNP